MLNSGHTKYFNKQDLLNVCLLTKHMTNYLWSWPRFKNHFFLNLSVLIIWHFYRFLGHSSNMSWVFLSHYDQLYLVCFINVLVTRKMIGTYYTPQSCLFTHVLTFFIGREKDVSVIFVKERVSCLNSLIVQEALNNIIPWLLYLKEWSHRSPDLMQWN